MDSNKTKKYSWVKGPLHKPPVKIPPHNDGPYTGQYAGVPGDYLENQDMRKTLPDDQEELIGMPHGTDRYGSCAFCRNPMYLLPTMLFCPSCKRMLAIETTPNSNRDGNDAPPKSLDEANIPENFHKGPTQQELRQNLGQYSGGGAQSNDVRGSKT